MARVRVVDPKGQKIGLVVGLIVGLVFIVIGCVMFYSIGQSEKKCTERVDGIVAELKTRKTKKTRKKTSTTTYAPVYEYTYNGTKYRVESTTSSNPPAFQQGQQVEIMIDPDEPTHIYVPGDKTARTLCIVFTAIGGVFSALSALILVLTIRRERATASTVYIGSQETVDPEQFWR
ncbi:MAG: DUF3592 domain-containing protein [Ruminococcus sp.]|nr:DUF3592 domain-containing protein [Ruminococcus sp.]